MNQALLDEIERLEKNPYRGSGTAFSSQRILEILCKIRDKKTDAVPVIYDCDVYEKDRNIIDIERKILFKIFSALDKPPAGKVKVRYNFYYPGDPIPPLTKIGNISSTSDKYSFQTNQSFLADGAARTLYFTPKENSESLDDDMYINFALCFSLDPKTYPCDCPIETLMRKGCECQGK